MLFLDCSLRAGEAYQSVRSGAGAAPTVADAMHGHTRPSAAKGRGAAAGSMEAAQMMRASLWECPLARPQSPRRRPALLFCRLLSWQVPGPSPVRLGACCLAGVPQPSPRVQRGVPQLLQPPCATRNPKWAVSQGACRAGWPQWLARVSGHLWGTAGPPDSMSALKFQAQTSKALLWLLARLADTVRGRLHA